MESIMRFIGTVFIGVVALSLMAIWVMRDDICAHPPPANGSAETQFLDGFSWGALCHR